MQESSSGLGIGPELQDRLLVCGKRTVAERRRRNVSSVNWASDAASPFDAEYLYPDWSIAVLSVTDCLAEAENAVGPSDFFGTVSTSDMNAPHGCLKYHTTMSSDSGTGGLPKDEADHFQQVQRVDERIYLGIQIAGGHILLPILVLTILFSKRITRHPVFVIFCLSWIFSSILYSLLVYRGRSTNDLLSLNPSYDTCLIQASLLNGVQALTACTNLALVVHLWAVLRYCNCNHSSETKGMGLLSRSRKETIHYCLLLGGPFLAFVVFTVVTMVIGSQPAESADGSGTIPDSNLSIPSVFYCIILQNADFSHSLTPGLNILRSVLMFTCLVSLITVGFEAHIARLVYKRREYLREKTFNWPALFLRVVLFSIYRIVALSLNVAIIVHPDELLLVGISKNNIFNGVIDFFQAAIPLVAFLAFASEKDILNVWCFWRKDKTQTEKSPVSREIA
ncbi:hypothetical protein ACEPAF_8489 [Sanghuangporus sanghuang]